MKRLLFSALIISAMQSCSVQKNTAAKLYSDNELLDKAQKDALKYFWDFAEPNSMLARERYHEDRIYPQNDANVVTTGGSGFGLATILVGIERGFVPRNEAVKRLTRATEFLKNAQRYKGAWPHWMNGNNGETVPFGKKDNGGDLVETAFLTQSLIMIREYFKNGNAEERKLAKTCDDLWKGVEWNWFTKGGEKVLYWHWSPTYNWEMNFPLQGYNECFVTYILAASSPNYSIDKETFDKGWTRSGKYTTTAKKYGLPLFVKHNSAEEFGGPLFWAHYSYIGLDPRKLSGGKVDNYFDLNRNQVLIDYKYCIENPKKFAGYSDKYWGLTASYSRNQDGSVGYNAHMPSNDLGVVSPTGAISSMPYTPKESLAFLHYIYEEKPQFVGSAGPYDATSIEYNWFTPRYLAIDQGTIAPMIENYRTGFLWRLFMNAPEIRQGLKKLGFHSGTYSF